jgi:hypothetical protein
MKVRCSVAPCARPLAARRSQAPTLQGCRGRVRGAGGYFPTQNREKICSRIDSERSTPWSSPAAWSAARSSSATMSGVAPDSSAVAAWSRASATLRRRSRSQVSRSSTVFRDGTPPETRRPRILSCNSARPCPSRAETSSASIAVPGRVEPPSLSPRSLLLRTTIVGTPQSRRRSSRSLSSRATLRSRRRRTRSARFVAPDALGLDLVRRYSQSGRPWEARRLQAAAASRSVGRSPPHASTLDVLHSD